MITEPIPAITLWEPWASAVAAGLKKNETRGWKPPVKLLGGPLAIHSAKRRFGPSSIEVDVLRRLDRDSYDRLAQHLGGDPLVADSYPLGCVVATAKLASAVSTQAAVASDRLVKGPEYLLGDYDYGRWAWVLEGVEPLVPPVPATGRQGLWSWLPVGVLVDA